MAKWQKFSDKSSLTKEKASWIRSQNFQDLKASKIREEIKKQKLQTVCEEAQCPNRGTCWSEGTATLLLMGKICTRGCRFCSVQTGTPPPLDPQEPLLTSQLLKSWKTQYLVLTMVDRDDLSDGGLNHFIKILNQVQKDVPHLQLETLTGDFQGRLDPLIAYFQKQNQSVKVFAHNVETVPSLTPRVRDPRATFTQSLDVLKKIKIHVPNLFTKTSFMLGLGESQEELIECFDQLREAQVDILTLGQYLQPTRQHLKVKSFIPKETFEELKHIALKKGFLAVASGPFVRSSYRSGFLFQEAIKKQQESPLLELKEKV